MSIFPVDAKIEFRAGDRGLYLLVGSIDYLAPNLQVLYTPNGTPISIAATYYDFYPRRWSVETVVEAAPDDAPSWDATNARIQADGYNTNLADRPAGLDAQSALTVFVDGFAEDMVKTLSAAKQNLLFVVGIVVVVLVLLIWLKAK